MKKVVFLIALIMISVLNTKSVSAKDIVYSNKEYQNAILTLITESYDEENHIDGMLTAGTFLAKTEEENNPALILIKYKMNGKVAWTYTYEKIQVDSYLTLNYTWNDKNEIDGYLVTVIQKETNQTIFLKIDLAGNFVWEKPSILNKNERIQKLIPTYQEGTIVNGYIGIASITEADFNKIALIIFYDKEMNPIWTKEYQPEGMLEVEYYDIIPLGEGYAILRREKNSLEEEQLDLIKVDLNGQESILLSNIEKQESMFLQKSENGFILYGITSKVKLKKGNESYYILRYDEAGNLLWESIGEVAIMKKTNIQLISKDNSFYFLYKNKEDASYEVIKLNSEGLPEKKIKKIKNDYYHFENYLLMDDTLYFVGQMNCPEDDNCDYNENSLFLISDEDRVIEVKGRDSEKVIVIILIFFLCLFPAFLFRRKKLQKKKA